MFLRKLVTVSVQIRHIFYINLWIKINRCYTGETNNLSTKNNEKTGQMRVRFRTFLNYNKIWPDQTRPTRFCCQIKSNKKKIDLILNKIWPITVLRYTACRQIFHGVLISGSCFYLTYGILKLDSQKSGNHLFLFSRSP